MKKKRFFKNYLIYPKFQIPLIIVGQVPFIATLLFLNWRIYDALNRIENLALDLGLPRSHQIFDILHIQGRTIDRVFQIATISCSLISLIVLLILSHRLAGPLYRLRLHLRELVTNRNKNREVHFRKGDFLVEMEPDLNTVFANYNPKNQ
jgi:hypothetical protein